MLLIISLPNRLITDSEIGIFILYFVTLDLNVKLDVNLLLIEEKMFSMQKNKDYVHTYFITKLS